MQPLCVSWACRGCRCLSHARLLAWRRGRFWVEGWLLLVVAVAVAVVIVAPVAKLPPPVKDAALWHSRGDKRTHSGASECLLEAGLLSVAAAAEGMQMHQDTATTQPHGPMRASRRSIKSPSCAPFLRLDLSRCAPQRRCRCHRCCCSPFPALCQLLSLFDLRLPEFSFISATSSAHLTLCTQAAKQHQTWRLSHQQVVLLQQAACARQC